MRKLDRRIKEGSFVMLDGSGDWHRVTEIVAETWVIVAGVLGHFSMGHIIRFKSSYR